jgi:hypothetical protein
MLSFALYFYILTIALVFWGRQILTRLNVAQEEKPQIMLELTSATAVMLVFAYALRLFVNNLTIYLAAFFLIGLLGSLLDFLYRHFRPWLNQEHKLEAIIKGLANRDTWLAAMILALLMSMVYSAIWPSGSMEYWTNCGADCYSWLFHAEYNLGLIDPTNPMLNFSFPLYENDSFGTHILIALVSLARAQLPYEASSAVLVTFIVFLGTNIYNFSREIFKFNFFQSLIVSSCLCFSSFLNFLSFFGMFGHLLSLSYFILSLYQVIIHFKLNQNSIYLFKNLFFPLFSIFLTYQAGYFLYSFFIFLFISLISFFSLKLSLPTRFLKSLTFGLSPVLAVSFFCCLIMPGLAYHLIFRSIEVANQTSGWPLPLIHPLLFSGLPFYLSTTQFTNSATTDPILFYYYLLFIIGIILLLFIIYFFKKMFYNNKIIIISGIFFIFAIISYIILYYYYGNIYKIWKFSGYIVLPLSFIPLSLIIFILLKLLSVNYKLLINIIILSFPVLFIIYLNIFSSFIELQFKYFKQQPNTLILYSLLNLSKNNTNSTFIFNYSDSATIILSSIILSKTSNQLIFYPGIYFIPQKNNLIDNISDQTFFITNIKQNTILNSFNLDNLQEFNFLHIYDSNDIYNQGIVEIKSYSYTFNWLISNYPVYYKFIIPSKLIGNDISFNITLSKYQNFSSACNQIEFGIFGDDKQIIWTKKSISDPTFPIPSTMTKNGRLEIFTRATFIKGERCVFNIDKVNLI